MKIYRGPRSSKKWQEIDAKSLAKWAEDWQPSKSLCFDATIDKAGTRHTDMGLEFTEEDLAALHDAFHRYQLKRIEKLKIRETALRKIRRLLSLHRKKAPTPDALLEAIRNIAIHFTWNETAETPIELGWIKYDDL